jgi:ubiquinone/menaquinone biosynthesis C-methylase UbiE
MTMAPPTDDSLEGIYFKLQSEFDFTKHIGSLDATDEIAELCGIGADSHVLDVGCGVGMTATYLAKTVGCRAIGIDIRDQMIERARARAANEGVADRVEFRVGDACALPFEDETFDVVICESVIALVEDQSAVLDEIFRVLVPGGRVGLTEAAWVKPPTEELLDYLRRSFGHMQLHAPAGWGELVRAAGFEDVVVNAHEISAKTEARARMRRYGLGHMLRIWGHVLRALVTRPEYRAFLKEALSEPRELLEYWGYVVAIGQKPSH